MSREKKNSRNVAQETDQGQESNEECEEEEVREPVLPPPSGPPRNPQDPPIGRPQVSHRRRVYGVQEFTPPFPPPPFPHLPPDPLTNSPPDGEQCCTCMGNIQVKTIKQTLFNKLFR